MSLEEALGTVIRSLNPYTKGKPGSMTLGLPIEISISTAASSSGVAVKDVPVEIDDYHEGRAEWIFKGQPHRVQRALRIQYRHKMDGAAGDADVFATEFLLIGFAGSNGGG